MSDRLADQENIVVLSKSRTALLVRNRWLAGWLARLTDRKFIFRLFRCQSNTVFGKAIHSIHKTLRFRASSEAVLIASLPA